MRVATVSRKRRSWVMNTTAPSKFCSSCSSHSMAVEVEMVGRLVQQQHVGRADQRLRQRHALLPASGQVAHRPVRRQSELSQHRVDAVRQRPAAALVEPALQRVHAGQARRAIAVRKQASMRDGSPSAAVPSSPRPSATASKTERSASNAGSCTTHAMRVPGATQESPASRSVIPARTRSNDDLPVPLRPMSPMRSRASSWKSAASSSGWWPNARRARESVSSGMRGSVAAPARRSGNCGGGPFTRGRERASRGRLDRPARARRACRARS